MADTALITGASAGIGEEFARQLSDRGYELVLVARRKDRLESLAKELPTRAQAIECDLATEAAELFGRVEGQVDLLVNNAGFGLRGRFLDLPADQQANMVRLNCEAVVTLTHAFLEPMVERGRGGIITVASTAGMQPLPYEAVYAATKAFAISFSDAIHTEYKDTGVKIMSVNPGPVPTEWQQVAGYDEAGADMPPGQISAEQVVRESIRAYERGKRFFIPGLFFRNFMRINSPAPRALQLRVTERMYRPKPKD